MQLTKAQPAASACLGVELGGALRSDRQVGDEDLGARGAQRLGDVDRRRLRLLDLVGDVAADAVEGRPALHRHRGGGVGEAEGVVRRGDDRRPERPPDLAGMDVEGRDHLDVAHVVAAEVDVHQPRRRRIGGGLGIVAQPLHERARAVADADDSNPHLVACHRSPQRCFRVNPFPFDKRR